MIGTQKPDTDNRESMVVRIDRRLYTALLEWAQSESIPIRAAIDAALWHHLTSTHRNPSLRSMVLASARAIADAIRSNGRSRAETLLPRWKAPRAKPMVLDPIPIPPPVE